MGLGSSGIQWISRAGDALQDLEVPDADLSVEFRCRSAEGETVHHQVFCGGRLVGWETGSMPDADLVLRQPWSANLAMIRGGGIPNQLLAVTEVVGRDGSAGPLPPLDEVRTDWGRELPVIPGVGGLIVQQVVTETPVGEVTLWLRLEGGTIVDSGLGLSEAQPDIVVMRRFELVVRERRGSVDVLDSLDGGALQGSSPKLMLFLGIVDSDECRRARQALAHPEDEALVALGKILCCKAWKTAAPRLAELTTETMSLP